MSFEITEGVSFVGKIDWELRRFHGDELSTHRGTSYNSYLVRGDKTALIDSVWTPFADEFVEKLRKIIDLDKIDFIVANHGEPDHSGALPKLLDIQPEIPVYCTANGKKSLAGYYGKDWDFRIVKTGDKLDLGEGKELTFIEATMLHWPDTMITYLESDGILFSNDVFGQHFAAEPLFDDAVEAADLEYEALKYYANIISPFAKKARKKLDAIFQADLNIKMICPAHGVIWKNPNKILDLYKKWSSNYAEDQITIVYDTMYGSDRLMAEAIGEGIAEASPNTKLKIFNAARNDKNDIITEIFRSKGALVGSPTYNGGVLGSIAALLEELVGLHLPPKKAGAFCSYGWSPMSHKIIMKRLEEAGFEIVGAGVKSLWKPDEKILDECREFGAFFMRETD